ncbi:hypothetical protein M2155_008024 [Streptomyces sp. SAI-119]|nr:hypothetical protein [Streptomyces sp. SAI-119]
MTSRVVGATVATGFAVALSVTAGSSALAQQQSSGDQASVSVLHGIPGLAVDVYAGDKELIPDFEPGTLTDSMKLDAGSYDIKIFKDGEGPAGTPAIEKTVDVPAGANATLVAHLTADGKPALDAFVNDMSKVPAGKARLTVRHVAAAPAVDVRAGGTPVFKDLVNPKEAKGEVDAGTVSANVVLAGTDTVAIGPADLDLAEGTNTVVYAWGSANEVEVGPLHQLRHGVRREELPVDPFTGHLPGDVLDAVLTNVEVQALAVVRPSAPRAVEAAVLVVHALDGARAGHQTVLAQQELPDALGGAPSGGRMRIGATLRRLVCGPGVVVVVGGHRAPSSPGLGVGRPAGAAARHPASSGWLTS